MGFSFERAEDSPGFLLWQLTNEWQRKQRQALAEFGLTHAQFVVLATLLWLKSKTEVPIMQSQIASHAKIDKMMVSDIIITLIQKKLVKRSPHKIDGRAYALSLTLKGEELTIKTIPVVEGIDANFFTKETPGLIDLNRLLNLLIKA